MQYDAIIVGGGLSGLTAAAYLTQENLNVLLCEKESRVGGLLNTFESNRFVFDVGARAIEDSGVLSPMLKQLGIALPLLENPVSIGIGEDIIKVEGEDSLEAYQSMLIKQFPKEEAAIKQIVAVVKRVMDYMDILYGIDNPLFMDLKNDKEYLKNTLMPWLFKYIMTVGKIKHYQNPIDEYLKTMTNDPVLVDIIAQHFFAKTPAFFALSYFSLYLDYRYPKGGTGALIDALKNYILSYNGTIKTNTAVKRIHLGARQIETENGEIISYKQLVWSADNKALYQSADLEGLSGRIKRQIEKQQQQLNKNRGGDSVLSLYIAADIEPSYFSDRHTAHFFYTPEKKGIGRNPISSIKVSDGRFTTDRARLFDWLAEYLNLTTYEISIPCLRDPSLAPKGKTGLIISTLFDFDLMQHLKDLDLYEETKTFISDMMIENLENSIYPDFKRRIINTIVSTPLTIKRITGSSDGAITGWSFTNGRVPAVSQMPKIAKSVITPMPNVIQAGQWTYSPSGLPISMLTGKLAANAVIKHIKRGD